ncbi:MAG TPA: hypothetical protein VF989_02190 [Polyangiaceae bacterium]
MRARWLPPVMIAVLGCEARVDTCARPPRASVAVYTGTRLLPGDALVPGRVVACGDDAAAVADLVTALERVPAQLAPSRVVLHVEPEVASGARAVGRVEQHRPSGAILVAAGDSELGQAVWLHEIAHVIGTGPAPQGRVAERLYGAIQEAFADYFAATFSGSSRVGALQGELRELERQRLPTASAWSALALPGAFPTHRFGAALAGLWWKRAPRDRTLVFDLGKCFASNDPWPQGAITPESTLREFVRRCPARSRDVVRETLHRWVPKELYQG